MAPSCQAWIGLGLMKAIIEPSSPVRKCASNSFIALSLFLSQAAYRHETFLECPTRCAFPTAIQVTLKRPTVIVDRSFERPRSNALVFSRVRRDRVVSKNSVLELSSDSTQWKDSWNVAHSGQSFPHAVRPDRNQTKAREFKRNTQVTN